MMISANCQLSFIAETIFQFHCESILNEKRTSMNGVVDIVGKNYIKSFDCNFSVDSIFWSGVSVGFSAMVTSSITIVCRFFFLSLYSLEILAYKTSIHRINDCYMSQCACVWESKRANECERESLNTVERCLSTTTVI